MARDVSTLTGSTFSGIHIGIGVIFIEVVLAVLAYNMIVDLDLRDAHKAEILPGGAPTGYIRGTIVGGSDLRTQEMNQVDIEAQTQHKNKKNKTQGRTRKQQMSCLSMELAMTTPGLYACKPRKHHSVQTVETHGVEDDCSPLWNQSFTKLVTYAESRQLEITVSDQQKTRKHIVGSATVVMKGENLLELDHCMDGSKVVIGLTWENPTSQKAYPAGSVTLQLAYIPTPRIVSSKARAITATWYFEATVVGAVFLNMIVLALQSPASPPPALLHGVLRVLEIFCATHMVMEFLLEFSVHLASKTLWFRDKWLVLLAFVITVSWLSIAAPAIAIGDSLTAKTSVEDALYTAPLNDAFYEASGAKTAPAASLIAGFVEHAVGGTPGAGTARKLLSVIRVLRILRPIRTVRMIDNIDLVITVITDSARLLCTVAVFMMFLLSVFTLIGLSCYTGALQYECMPQSQNGEKPQCNAEQNFSAAVMQVDCPLRCPRSLSCSTLHDEMWCAPLQGGRRAVGNDQYGLRDYDTFLRGFVATFVQTAGDGGMHSIPLALTASGTSMPAIAWLISFTTSTFMNMLCLNLFLAVLCSAYSDIVSATEERKLAQQQSRDKYRALLAQRISGDDDLQEVDTVEETAAAQPVISTEDRIYDKDWFAEGSRLPGIRERLKKLAMSLWFERTSSTVIICNTLSMALVHEDMSNTFRDNLRTCELVFLCVFVAEAAIKLVGFGSSIFFSSAENKLDVFIIAVSLVGFIGTYYTEEVQTLFRLEQRSLESAQSLRGIRLIRTLQIIRLLQRQKALAAVLRTISLSWKPLLVHSCFCLYSICGVAIVGMHVLGGSLGTAASLADYDVEEPANLETFSRGALTFFELFVGEEWSHVMYWYSRYAAIGFGFPPFAVQLFFIVTYVWLNSILFSLCIAMMLENFTVA